MKVLLWDHLSVPVRAVVFDLIFTLVSPSLYPGSRSRLGWIADLTGISEQALRESWVTAELDLEAGRSPIGCEPVHDSIELGWLQQVAIQCGQTISSELMNTIERDWDLCHRPTLQQPPPENLGALRDLKRQGFVLGVLSNTHRLEVRSWPQSPIPALVDAARFSYEIGAMKPHPDSYQSILDALGVSAGEAAFVGDGGSSELAGAKSYGFALVVFARQFPSRLWPHRLPALTEQADLVVDSLSELASLPALSR